MTLVKVNQEIVQIISRNQNHFTVLTRENEVKRISAEEINSVNDKDIIKKLSEMRNNKIVYLQEYMKIKNYRNKKHL